MAFLINMFTALKSCCGLQRAKLLQQGYRFHRLRKTFSKFYRRHYELISKFNVGLKTLLYVSRSEPEFYGVLVYKFKIFIGRNEFSFQFKNFFTRYRRIGYNLNVMRQSACLVFLIAPFPDLCLLVPFLYQSSCGCAVWRT